MAERRMCRHPNNEGCLPSPVQKCLRRQPNDTTFMARGPFATRKDSHLPTQIKFRQPNTPFASPWDQIQTRPVVGRNCRLAPARDYWHKTSFPFESLLFKFLLLSLMLYCWPLNDWDSQFTPSKLSFCRKNKRDPDRCLLIQGLKNWRSPIDSPVVKGISLWWGT
jgi:hypothetical protein